MENNTLKEQFKNALRETGRPGIENVLNWLETTDFYTAPASSVFHGNYEGGLLEHSMNIVRVAIKIKGAMDSLLSKQIADTTDPIIKNELAQRATRLNALTTDSIILAGALHDVCKANVYKMDSRNVKNDLTGKWDKVPYYKPDYTEFPAGHGEKSVIILLRLGLELTDEELLAIRWHMSAWDMPFQSAEAKSSISVARDKHPLVSILQSADQLTTAILETKK